MKNIEDTIKELEYLREQQRKSNEKISTLQKTLENIEIANRVQNNKIKETKEISDTQITRIETQLSTKFIELKKAMKQETILRTDSLVDKKLSYVLTTLSNRMLCQDSAIQEEINEVERIETELTDTVVLLATKGYLTKQEALSVRLGLQSCLNCKYQVQSKRNKPWCKKYKRVLFDSDFGKECSAFQKRPKTITEVREQ